MHKTKLFLDNATIKDIMGYAIPWKCLGNYTKTTQILD